MISVKISAIIPTRGDRSLSINHLLTQLSQQSIALEEVLVIENKPYPGKARNIGALQARGDYLFFLDDDAILEGDDVVKKLITALANDDSIGMVGGAIALPEDVNGFQKHYARQFPRSVINPPEQPVDSDLVTTLCCLIKKDLFEELGGFREDLIAGEDPEFRDRIRRAGYRTVLAPAVRIFHPPPQNLRAALKRSYWYGLGDALIFYIIPNDDWRKSCRPFSFWRAFGKAIILPLSLLINFAALKEKKVKFAFGWIYFLCGYAHLAGYFKGRLVRK